VGVVNQAVHDCVGERGVADGVEQLLDGQLARDVRVAALVPVFEDLQQFGALTIAELHQAELVDDEHVRARESPQPGAVLSVVACESGFSVEARGTVVGCAESELLGAVGEGAGKVALPDAGGAGKEDVLVAAQPCSVSELSDESLVEAACHAEVDIFEARLVAELRTFEPAREDTTECTRG
jgi:hypothetical protein